jgi:hypothetical protein
VGIPHVLRLLTPFIIITEKPGAKAPGFFVERPALVRTKNFDAVRISRCAKIFPAMNFILQKFFTVTMLPPL